MGVEQADTTAEIQQLSVGLSSDSPLRLRSFRAPRDLTLGAIKLPPSKNNPNKKTVLPNLNCVRTKNKEVKTSKDTRDIAKGKKKPERTKSLNDRNNKNRNIIQTNGLFSEGAGKLVVKKASYSNSRDAGSTTGGDAIKRPVVKKGDIQDKIDVSGDDQKLTEMLGNIPVFDFSKMAVHFAPQQLKYTPSTESDTTKGGSSYPSDLDELFNRPGSNLVLLQLPKCLPANAPEEEPPESAEELKATTSSADPTNPNKRKFSSLHQFEEGCMGKIVRYKSGRVEMTMAGSIYDINLGLQTHPLNLVSVVVNREERNGEMYDVGRAGTKLIACQNWDKFFSQKASRM